MGDMSSPSPPPSSDWERVSATLERTPPDLPAPLPPGTVLRDRYCLTSILKNRRGAVVYRAEEVGTGRSVIVQIFHEIGRNARARIQSLRRPTSSRAPRPELPGTFVAVYECDLTDEGQLFLVTEAVQGRALGDLLRQTPALAPARALELATRIGEALEATLNLGLLELSLAPADIVVDDADNVKILRSDVLILRQLGLADQFAATEATERDPRYVSPEELAGLPATERSVVYRFGVLLYELLSGRVPYDGATPDEVRARQLRSPLKRLSDPHLATLDHLVSRMLDPDPVGRPADPTWILNELWDAACRLRVGSSPTSTDVVASSAAIGGPPSTVRRFWTQRLAFAGLPILVVGGTVLAWSHVLPSLSTPRAVPVPVHPVVVVSPPSMPAVVSPAPVLPPSDSGVPSGFVPSRLPDLRPAPSPPQSPPASLPGSGASPGRVTAARTVTQAEGRPMPDARATRKGVASAAPPLLTAPLPEAQVLSRATGVRAESETTPISPMPSPSFQESPTVAVPPARPPARAPDDPRAGDPTAIIEWLVREGPKPGQ
jgi:serine/threonine protein kinase